MSQHPLSESFLRKATGTAVTLLAGAVLWLLLALYGDTDSLTALLVGFAYILLLAFAGYMYWYIIDYLQAYGDYVTLFTENRKYLKEQTMKYFEIHLPLSFVRIHRSCIVNSEKITRVELFGKESYNVYLKNGSNLRASTTGYKLLKEKMLL